MTATDTHTEIDHDADGVQTSAPDAELVALNDHKFVGRLWIGAALLFLVGLSVVGVLNNIERIDGTDLYGTIASYFQAWVLYRTGMVFLVALPLFIGIATVVVPLQVGSASIAFPRLAAAAFWSWFTAGCVHIVSFLVDGGLGPENATREEGTLLTIVSLGFVIVALLAASICIATTVIALRPTGMTLTRVPAFTWSMLVATSVWLLSLPVLIANLIYAYVDLYHWGPTEVDGVAIERLPIAFGRRDEIWSTVEWAWQSPQVFAYAIPVLGILAEVVPTLAKQRQANRGVVLTLIGVFGLFSFGAWAQHALSTGADPAFQDAAVENQGRFIYEEFLYIAFALAIAVPVLGVLGGVLDTIRRGSAPKPSGALLGAAAGAILLLAAVLIGEIRVLGDIRQIPGNIFPNWLLDMWDALHDDAGGFLSSATAMFTVTMAAVVASAVGALSYWSSKIFGGYSKDPVASIAVLALLGGGLLAGIADLVSAFAGQLDVSVADLNDSTIDTMNVLSTIGVALLALGALALVAAFVPAMFGSETLPDDPWDGHTLEWASPSPPPIGNFVEPIETIHSSEPLLDEFEEVN